MLYFCCYLLHLDEWDPGYIFVTHSLLLGSLFYRFVNVKKGVTSQNSAVLQNWKETGMKAGLQTLIFHLFQKTDFKGNCCTFWAIFHISKLISSLYQHWQVILVIWMYCTNWSGTKNNKKEPSSMRFEKGWLCLES